MSIFVNANSGSGRELNDIILSLVFQVIVPIVAGVSLNRYWGEFARSHAKMLGKFDQTTILLIVYTSFCKSFQEKQFDTMSTQTLIFLSLGMIGLFFVAYTIMGLICRVAGFKPGRQNNRSVLRFKEVIGSWNSYVTGDFT